MLSRLKFFAFFLFLCLTTTFLQAQSELRLGFLTSKPLKGNHGIQLEYALPIGKFFEFTPSIWAMNMSRTSTYFSDCYTGEPFLISKQRIAQHNYVYKSTKYLLSLGFNVKPLAKISKKHELGLGALFAYGYNKYEDISNIETEDGTYRPTNVYSGKGAGGSIMAQFRYAYTLSSKTKLGVRYMNVPNFQDFAGIGSIYGAYKF
jgi:hypothetical protein